MKVIDKTLSLLLNGNTLIVAGLIGFSVFIRHTYSSGFSNGIKCIVEGPESLQYYQRDQQCDDYINMAIFKSREAVKKG